MLGFAWVCISVVVVAFGRIEVRASAPIGRRTRRLRRLLWLSLLMKVAVGAWWYPLGAPLASLALLLGVGLTLIEFGLIFYWLYPIERTERELPATAREYLIARLGMVWDALAPIAAFGLGALTLDYLWSGESRAAGAWGALTVSAMGLGALLSGLSISRRATPFPARCLPVRAHFLEEAQRLGRELGVTVREIVVLDGTRLRRADAFALSGGRIALTDYLLASLTEQQILAVIAHEVAHLAQRKRLVRLWLLTLAGGVGGAVVVAPFAHQLPPWGLLVWLGLIAFALMLPMQRLRRRHEREADAFAVSQYGVEALQGALRVIATLHQREPDHSSDAVHPSLTQRLQALQKFTR
ncbi:MAG: M48 family metalloprotease [bacterium]|nr:M48 family metalloprotease [bacterium]